ncbi:zf-HC2 domain-containing protein [Amycolatopsis sp. H20-H5]|uniref:zf-HC2 domain-containing protein n=1 Tax=Amycolatopsis sp. H20-H5 TaxID=3046309 RepID=UPI002DBB4B7D|nr:zf-HC2 domain-containing protein [Amycolatopsis sp. H20-H5]MEC3975974.1 zf-HC2 domain-containing protein [Amycolatopsis sp. H20-H5]
MSGEHASERLITAYVQGEQAITGDEIWALESHLESCAVCRGRLSAVGPPAVTALLDSVWAGLEPELAKPPMPRRRRWSQWLATWASPAMLSWLCMIVLVTFLAVTLDRISAGMSGDRSLVLLVAPVLPVAGVFASWARGLDPAYELIAATPRAGLDLVFRRTVAVLVVVIPLLLAAGWSTGASLMLTLLPSLAFTTGTLALGSVIGLSRAAVALVVVWVAVILAPSFTVGGLPGALQPGVLPVWGAVFAAGAVVVVARRGAYARLGSQRW